MARCSLLKVIMYLVVSCHYGKHKGLEIIMYGSITFQSLFVPSAYDFIV